VSYIITADVPLSTEQNQCGDVNKVEARVLSHRPDISVTFDVPGKFGEQEQRTRALCNTLIDAGFVEFRIGHSY